jgi:hypothetical protein
MQIQTAADHKIDVMSDVASAFEGGDVETPQKPVEPAEKPAPQPQKEGENDDKNTQQQVARSRDGKFTKKQENTETVENKPEQQAEGQEEQEKPAEAVQDDEDTKPLDQWPEDVKKEWAQLPRNSKKFLSESYKGIMRAANERFQAAAEDRKLATTYKDAVNPYIAMIQAEGSEPVTAVKSLLSTAYTLRHGQPQQKAQLIRGLIEKYGVDIGTIDQGVQQVDPEIHSLRQGIGTLQQQLQQIQALNQQQQQQYQSQKIDSILTSFEQNKETPYFAEVYQDMMPLVTGIMRTEPNLDESAVLKKAYDAAVWGNPTTRAKMLAQQSKTVANVQQASKAANAAGASVRGAPNGAAALNPKVKVSNDPRDDIAATWEAMENGNA